LFSGENMKKLAYLGTLAAVLCSLPALAAPSSSSSPAYSPASASAPDYIGVGFGDYDFDRDGDRDSIDYRLDYQWGASVLPMLDHSWGGMDRYFQIHPVAGFEGNGNGMTYFSGGLNMDVPVVSRLVFTWGEAMGLYGHGDDKQTLGSAFEVRSQLELGWRFDNGMRLSGYVSELSNLGVGDRDPGSETIGAYLRVPVSWLAK
jgi:lipid A 3-O-deacylase